MTELRKEFKKDHPETIGETDRAFDDGNYIEWLEKKLTEARTKLKNNSDLGDVVERYPVINTSDPIKWNKIQVVKYGRIMSIIGASIGSIITYALTVIIKLL